MRKPSMMVSPVPHVKHKMTMRMTRKMEKITTMRKNQMMEIQPRKENVDNHLPWILARRWVRNLRVAAMMICRVRRPQREMPSQRAV